jgi:hypothetical protein
MGVRLELVKKKVFWKHSCQYFGRFFEAYITPDQAVCHGCGKRFPDEGQAFLVDHTGQIARAKKRARDIYKIKTKHIIVRGCVQFACVDCTPSDLIVHKVVVRICA